MESEPPMAFLRAEKYPEKVFAAPKNTIAQQLQQFNFKERTKGTTRAGREVDGLETPVFLSDSMVGNMSPGDKVYLG